ncbi:hypothetical protein [Nocardia sp. NPDC005366]|uniref:hypothetical protein n=1 Tax=Nocardia sp. NPDC005366 TaxID=3156878 RepID=UPI0033B538BE
MQTLIVLVVVAVVLLLVFAVVQYASRPPRDISRWDDFDPADSAEYGYEGGRGADR